ncbi:hypothetical protein MSP8887_03351 [Marinomonas spartinae]|uniref:DUF2496 domain-containing protein n=1 Tax=Marinomonas spartinae TaxID=1792290 RepID=UPI000808A792|nr:DUF2496 domain-containing protein [Marinomonas spartinae]SBS38536.1 hypothetical protein MSP8887_03351 [Marinomonas spartinae]
MSLDNAPTHIKLAVDLIEMLEESNTDNQTIIDALTIALNDFKAKQKQEEQSS